ncbi:putative electron transfer flavoprotein subunit [Modicella reniformis]|uniref:Electron transfer flavoprotein subunit n=1 Tax=Modicella reniformis TaxID=1440133 RepID=A0A9P6MKV9_9FUNG|nr:putative electron transfer flavoprotein subunit [Modicella reniformis]
MISTKPYSSPASTPASKSTSPSSMSMDIPTSLSDASLRDMHVKLEEPESTGSVARRPHSSSPERQGSNSSQQDPVHQSTSQPERPPSSQSTSAPKRESRVGVTATSCANCGTTTTPLWRRASNGQTICNACGLYFKARNHMRPPWLKRNATNRKGESSEDIIEILDESTGSNGESSSGKGCAPEGGHKEHNHVHDSECAGTCPGDGNCNGEGGSESCAGCPSFNQHHTHRQNQVCANCRTTTTPLWRRDTNGNTICNACGLYFKLHNVHRPVTMKRAIIKRRKRVHVANSPPRTGQEASQEASANQQQQQSATKSQLKSQKSKQTSHNPVPMTVSELEPSDVDAQVRHTSTKRKRVQSANGGRAVPAIEDYIAPKRTTSGQDEWSRNDQSTPEDHHRGSPMDHTSSGHDDSDMGHSEDQRYGSPGHVSQDQRSSYHQRPQDQHDSPGDYPSQPSRYQFNLHQSNGHYQPTQLEPALARICHCVVLTFQYPAIVYRRCALFRTEPKFTTALPAPPNLCESRGFLLALSFISIAARGLSSWRLTSIIAWFVTITIFAKRTYPLFRSKE